MTEIIQTISPVDNSIYVERPVASFHQIESLIRKADNGARLWKALPISERIEICERFVKYCQENKAEMAHELTMQMGRPISQTPNEIEGMCDRATVMMRLAEQSLAPIEIERSAHIHKFIAREPLGVIFTIAPWNYPYLTAVNSIIPALVAGNAVILKHSAQTPLCAERFELGFLEAGMPEGVFQYIHCRHDQCMTIIKQPAVEYVSFTGSVKAGKLIQQAAQNKFIHINLELGGKDPAYVRSDADLDHAVENLVSGAFYNSGQSCCGVERIYVHRSKFTEFVDRFVNLTEQYKLGDPLSPETTLGPLVSIKAAAFVRAQCEEALQLGAQQHIDENAFPNSEEGTPYLAPQVLTNVNHRMQIMSEESFGPVVGIMPVISDEEAVSLMNDSQYGLSASIWTKDIDAALQVGDCLQTGTVFMNRCDYLDPTLAWTGVKNTGRGCSLSVLGYEHLTRPKSYYLRKQLGE